MTTHALDLQSIPTVPYPAGHDPRELSRRPDDLTPILSARQ